LDNEEIKYHEHDFECVEKPAVASAKKLCWFVLAVLAGLIWYYLQAPPATKSLIDQYDTWPCVVVGAIVIVVALKAVLS
jgi:uncharacterized membrane protein YwaF